MSKLSNDVAHELEYVMELNVNIKPNDIIIILSLPLLIKEEEERLLGCFDDRTSKLIAPYVAEAEQKLKKFKEIMSGPTLGHKYLGYKSYLTNNYINDRGFEILIKPIK